jgi:hypothetical protein
MSNENYHFSLRMDNTEFSVGGDKEFVESYISKWLTIFKDKLPSELLGEKHEEEHTPQTHTRGKVSINDFIKLKSPKNYNDLTLTVFFYYERYEGLENVGVSFKHLSDFFSKIPNHPSDDDLQVIISQVETDGFIQLMPGTEANPRYQVTFTGEQCVKQGFNEV